MNRRSFFKKLGISGLVASVAPQIIQEVKAEEPEPISLDGVDLEYSLQSESYGYEMNRKHSQRVILVNPWLEYYLDECDIDLFRETETIFNKYGTKEVILGKLRGKIRTPTERYLITTQGFHMSIVKGDETCDVGLVRFDNCFASGGIIGQGETEWTYSFYQIEPKPMGRINNQP